ncbi:cilia- and flagella-associated protein 100-like isoform X1 [Siniperca chuatsi]|uniref:cilia- and flagella-associated protein 100-like isoform X1 n=1 Tax=Siniperca chuatsi TaxID=119488 RepID=UPI001CE1232B|nr:cilia- and flagella-associated protein 100-like isoform X1 [Siniperca chuatsi]XP_044022028.1 cilia- and flagella-associated protein 100-like isoform X1 [Siniperca chuatsi]XP_044022030.1 cilia- and flagella-associated protein 100-like isoform X1 [Siniperca chuatsi]
MPKEISEMSSPKLELRGRETGQSQLKVPESNIMSTETVKAKGHRKEVLRKFLTKTENLAGQVVEEGKQETVKIPQQIKNNTTLSKQTQDSPDLKMSAIKHETIKRDRKRDLLCIERQRALLEASLIKSRSHIMKMDKNIAAKEQYLKQLERITERENYNLEEFLKRSEEKSVDSRKLFEKESKSKQERNAAIKKLTDEIRTLKSKFAKIEEILNKYRRYKNVLFMLTPPEWHEGKEAEALKAKVTSDRDTQDVQNREPQESAIRQGLERGLESSPGGVLPSTREPMLSTAHSGTLITTSKLDCNSSEHEEKLELYFSDPQQLLDLQTELTEQNLSLIQNSTRGDETLEELRQNIETTLKKMKEDEEKLTLQVNDMKDRIDKEKERAAMLRKKVQVHDSLKREDQDVLLDALGMKVTEVYCCCVDGRLTNLSTLEKLSSVEYRMSLQLQLLENIPEESLETLRQIKDSQRRSRLREEKLRLEREKQKERMKKCMQRSLGDTKKIRGRKLMPRCIPVELKSKVSDEDNIPAEDELHAYLFTTEDVE